MIIWPLFQRQEVFALRASNVTQCTRRRQYVGNSIWLTSGVELVLILAWISFRFLAIGSFDCLIECGCVGSSISEWTKNQLSNQNGTIQWKNLGNSGVAVKTLLFLVQNHENSENIFILEFDDIKQCWTSRESTTATDVRLSVGPSAFPIFIVCILHFLAVLKSICHSLLFTP